jgi:3'(2'), 5'-bisphosphate nucleotidase
MNNQEVEQAWLWIPDLMTAMHQASRTILSIYHTNKLEIQLKSDQSPVTWADRKSHEILTQYLSQLSCVYPVLSEESEPESIVKRAAWPTYWLIDPLDGTQEFIQETDEFAINVALIHHHKPILGMVMVPTQGLCYWAIQGRGAYKTLPSGETMCIHAHQTLHVPLKVIVSRRSCHQETWLKIEKKLPDHKLIYCGSALKICLVASGQADIYVRCAPTGEWDTAAGQCILEEAGGVLLDFAGQPLRYNDRSTLINPYFFALGSQKSVDNFVDCFEKMD